MIFFFLCAFFSTLCFPYIFLIILKSFATYGCRHPCCYRNLFKHHTYINICKVSLWDSSKIFFYVCLEIIYNQYERVLYHRFLLVYQILGIKKDAFLYPYNSYNKDLGNQQFLQLHDPCFKVLMLNNGYFLNFCNPKFSLPFSATLVYHVLHLLVFG